MKCILCTRQSLTTKAMSDLAILSHHLNISVDISDI